MILGGFLEMLSVSLMLPFMNMVMNPNQTMKSKYVQYVCNILGITEISTFIVFIAIVVATLYILKNVFLMFEYNCQYRFVFNSMYLTQKKLLHNYIHRPYEFFLTANTADIMRIIVNDTEQAYGLLLSLLSLLSEMMVCIVLLITVCIIAPMITFCMAFLLITILGIILKIIRPVLKTYGEEYIKSYTGMNKWLLQSIEGIRDVKVSQKEVFFEKSYEINGKKYATARRIHTILGLVPRFLIEAVSMSTIFLVVAYMVAQGTPLIDIVPVVTTITMAAVRLLPAINRISSSMASVAFMSNMVDIMSNNLDNLIDSRIEVPITEKRNTFFKTDIELKDIIYKYPAGEKNVLDRATLKIKKGEAIGIVGISGSGKSTTADLILGLLRPNHGSVTVDNVEINSNITSWLNCIGYIPQTIFLLDDSVKANVAFGIEKSEINDEQVWKALEEAALSEYVKTLPDGLNTKLGERGMRLSGGQRQRIGISRALYNNPEVIIFDEATSALDHETEAAIMESIEKLQGKKTIIIIAHRKSTIEKCDHIYRVENGQIKLER